MQLFPLYKSTEVTLTIHRSPKSPLFNGRFVAFLRPARPIVIEMHPVTPARLPILILSPSLRRALDRHPVQGHPTRFRSLAAWVTGPSSGRGPPTPVAGGAVTTNPFSLF